MLVQGTNCFKIYPGRAGGVLGQLDDRVGYVRTTGDEGVQKFANALSVSKSEFLHDGGEFWSGDWGSSFNLFVEDRVVMHRNIGQIFVLGDGCFEPVFVAEDLFNVSSVVYLDEIACLGNIYAIKAMDNS